MPGARAKRWRAFLSVTKGPAGTPVNAIDRIGNGPWYDRKGRLVSMTKNGLLMRRPQGAETTIINDLPNEDGVPNHDPDGTGVIDNHNVLTGSTPTGTIDPDGLSATCQDWTNNTARGGEPRCGVSWPRGGLINWISVLNEGGCAPGVTPRAKTKAPTAPSARWAATARSTAWRSRRSPLGAAPPRAPRPAARSPRSPAPPRLSTYSKGTTGRSRAVVKGAVLPLSHTLSPQRGEGLKWPGSRSGNPRSRAGGSKP